MIYTPDYEAREKAYEAIEAAAAKDKPVELPEGVELHLVWRCHNKYLVDGLYWTDERNNVWQAVLEPQIRHGMILPEMYVVIRCALDWSSDGNVKKLRKENRYHTKC